MLFMVLGHQPFGDIASHTSALGGHGLYAEYYLCLVPLLMLIFLSFSCLGFALQYLSKKCDSSSFLALYSVAVVYDLS